MKRPKTQRKKAKIVNIKRVKKLAFKMGMFVWSNKKEEKLRAIGMNKQIMTII